MNSNVKPGILYSTFFTWFFKTTPFLVQNVLSVSTLQDKKEISSPEYRLQIIPNSNIGNIMWLLTNKSEVALASFEIEVGLRLIRTPIFQNEAGQDCLHGPH